MKLYKTLCAIVLAVGLSGCFGAKIDRGIVIDNEIGQPVTVDRYTLTSEGYGLDFGVNSENQVEYLYFRTPKDVMKVLKYDIDTGATPDGGFYIYLEKDYDGEAD